jgi:cadmium resistance protein CadD (predicted permease)
MNQNTLQLILSFAKLGSDLLVQFVPVFVHQDAAGNVVQLSPILLLSPTEARNEETLKSIAVANAQQVKGVV